MQKKKPDNGKGDESRITNYKNYYSGYDAINWGPRCDCHNHLYHVCDICQNVKSSNLKDNE